MQVIYASNNDISTDFLLIMSTKYNNGVGSGDSGDSGGIGGLESCKGNSYKFNSCVLHATKCPFD